ncbi:MAG: SDR family oxidoreductase [Ktedonobacterales bacterium]|nr:SDR family oxidoreductase [Ktedonobacterales bacterium]
MTPEPATASLGGQVAIVTGASQGIGAAVAQELARHGAKVALIARSSDLLTEVTAQIAQSGGQAVALPGDISDPAQVADLFAQAEARLGPCTILINAAGLVVNTPFRDLELAEWDAVFNTNVRGLMLCCQAAFRQMASQGGGTILNFSSLSGVKNVEKFPGLSAYVASKFAVAGLTEALAVEGKPLGIRVMAVSPGAVDTPMLRAAAPQLHPGMTPLDMARIVAFMVSPAGRFLDGTNLELFSNA